MDFETIPSQFDTREAKTSQLIACLSSPAELVAEWGAPAADAQLSFPDNSSGLFLSENGTSS